MPCPKGTRCLSGTKKLGISLPVALRLDWRWSSLPQHTQPRSYEIFFPDATCHRRSRNRCTQFENTRDAAFLKEENGTRNQILRNYNVFSQMIWESLLVHQQRVRKKHWPAKLAGRTKGTNKPHTHTTHATRFIEVFQNVCMLSLLYTWEPIECNSSNIEHSRVSNFNMTALQTVSSIKNAKSKNTRRLMIPKTRLPMQHSQTSWICILQKPPRCWKNRTTAESH